MEDRLLLLELGFRSFEGLSGVLRRLAWTRGEMTV